MRIAADYSSKGTPGKPRKNRGHVGGQRAVFCHAMPAMNAGWRIHESRRVERRNGARIATRSSHE
jgi:hypothetical protein